MAERRTGCGQQQLGCPRQPDGIRQTAIGGRFPSLSGHSEFYYQNHIACPQFDVIGLSFPGVPRLPPLRPQRPCGLVCHPRPGGLPGSLRRAFLSGRPAHYEFQGQWKKAEVRRETIIVKGGAAHEMEVTVTHHGPIIAGDPGKGYGLAFKYTATAAPYVGFECLLPMMKAASVDELDESMRNWVDPCNNLLSADVHGNIAYLHRGQVPVRSMANAWLPVPGWSGGARMAGEHPLRSPPEAAQPLQWIHRLRQQPNPRRELPLLHRFKLCAGLPGPANLRTTQESSPGRRSRRCDPSTGILFPFPPRFGHGLWRRPSRPTNSLSERSQ